MSNEAMVCGINLYTHPVGTIAWRNCLLWSFNDVTREYSRELVLLGLFASLVQIPDLLAIKKMYIY